MSRDLRRFSRLKNEIKQLIGKNLLDIVIFGSYSRGKIWPNDIDICIILKEVSKNVINNINKGLNGVADEKTHISYLSAENFFTDFHSLSKTVLFEGISLISGEAISKRYGLSSYCLYTYKLPKDDNVKRVRFVYLLKGRVKEKGMVEQLGGRFVSNGTFLVPVSKDAEMMAIFDQRKIRFTRRKVLLMD